LQWCIIHVFRLETAKNEEFDLCYDFFSAFITLSKCLPQAIDTLQIQQYAMLLSISAKLSSEMKSRNKVLFVIDLGFVSGEKQRFFVGTTVRLATTS